MNRRIEFIGTGHIAAPMARLLARKGNDVTVSDRNAETAAALAAKHGIHITDNQSVINRTEIVFLCLRPQVALGILDPLYFRPKQRVVSVMAGISLAELARVCAPATDITVTIPLGFLETGACPLAACPSHGPLNDLFGPENPVVAVPHEASLNAHFAICALVPALLDLMGSAAGWLADRTGDPAAAEFYTTQLVAGFLAATEREQGALVRERDALATKGTISLQMTTLLREGGAHEVLTTALEAIGTRLEGRP